MDFNGKNIVLAVDDSLMVCKQIQTALKDDCLLYTSRCV